MEQAGCRELWVRDLERLLGWQKEKEKCFLLTDLLSWVQHFIDFSEQCCKTYMHPIIYRYWHFSVVTEFIRGKAEMDLKLCYSRFLFSSHCQPPCLTQLQVCVLALGGFIKNFEPSWELITVALSALIKNMRDWVKTLALSVKFLWPVLNILAWQI